MWRSLSFVAIVSIGACKPAQEKPAQATASPTSAKVNASPLDVTGWKSAGTNRWSRKDAELALEKAPALNAADVAGFRQRSRADVLARGGGLISADVSSKGAGVVIAKYPLELSGLAFEGTLWFTKNGASYRAIVRFVESGITGMREAVVLDRHMAEQPANADPLDGWMRDPYDPSRKDALMRSKADDEEHDARFADHPLLQLRAELRRIERSL